MDFGVLQKRLIMAFLDQKGAGDELTSSEKGGGMEDSENLQVILGIFDPFHMSTKGLAPFTYIVKL